MNNQKPSNPPETLVPGKKYVLISEREEVTFVSFTSDPVWIVVEHQSGKRSRAVRSELKDTRPMISDPQT